MAVAEQVRSGSALTRGWLLGPVVGVGGFLTVAAFGSVGFSVTDGTPVPEMLAVLADASAEFQLVGGAQALVALAMVVMGVWVGLRLRSLEPVGSLCARVAGGGFALAAAMLAMGAAHMQLATVAADETADPAINLTLFTLAENLFAGAWCAVALASGAVAVLALRHRVLPAWFGAVSGFVTVLLLVLQVIVPWAGWFPAVIWLAVCGIGLRPRGPRTA